LGLALNFSVFFYEIYNSPVCFLRGERGGEGRKAAAVAAPARRRKARPGQTREKTDAALSVYISPNSHTHTDLPPSLPPSLLLIGPRLRPGQEGVR
jgi:hypothetical protein